jgi:hypothetical protein
MAQSQGQLKMRPKKALASLLAPYEPSSAADQVDLCKTRGQAKHFGVSRVIQPDDPTAPIEQVKIEAVFSKAVQVIAWRDLQDDSVWRQGWVGFCTYSIQVYFVALGSGKPTTRPTNSKKAETALGS